MSANRSIDLRLYLSRYGGTYVLTRRGGDKQGLTERRLEQGSLRYGTAKDAPEEVLVLLLRAVLAIMHRHGIEPPHEVLGAPSGGHGGRQGVPSSLPEVNPVSGGVGGLDRPLPGL